MLNIEKSFDHLHESEAVHFLGEQIKKMHKAFYLLPLLDKFRTVNWADFAKELGYLSSIRDNLVLA
jgi:hypothetical protein